MTRWHKLGLMTTKSMVLTRSMKRSMGSMMVLMMKMMMMLLGLE
jgi:hypothetical protein